MRRVSAYGAVRSAIRDLSSEAPKPEEVLFVYYFSAARVAERAGCSVTTARKYLEQLSRCLGYRRARLTHGDVGYRYDG